VYYKGKAKQVTQSKGDERPAYYEEHLMARAIRETAKATITKRSTMNKIMKKPALWIKRFVLSRSLGTYVDEEWGSCHWGMKQTTGMERSGMI
jgi:hypothetical protein